MATLTKTFPSVHALVIGVSAYKGHGLPNCVKDAQCVGQYLIDSAGLDEDNVHILTDPDTSRDDIVREVFWLARNATPQGLYVFYYAGHALLYKGKHHLLGKHFSGQEHEIVGSGYAVEDVIMVLKDYHSGVMLLDACRKEFEGQTRGIAQSWDGCLVNTQLSAAQGLRGIDTSSGAGAVLVAHACPLFSVADDGRNFGLDNGLFTSELLRVLFEPGMSVLAAISKANRQVTRRSQGKQTPKIEGTDLDQFTTFSLGCCKEPSAATTQNVLPAPYIADMAAIADQQPKPQGGSTKSPITTANTSISEDGQVKQLPGQRTQSGRSDQTKWGRVGQGTVPLPARNLPGGFNQAVATELGGDLKVPRRFGCRRVQKTWAVAFLVLLVLAAVGVGVGVGVPLANKHRTVLQSPASSPSAATAEAPSSAPNPAVANAPTAEAPSSAQAPASYG